MRILKKMGWPSIHGCLDVLGVKNVLGGDDDDNGWFRTTFCSLEIIMVGVEQKNIDRWASQRISYR